MSLLQTLMYSGDGSGDTPVKMGTRGQSPQHSTPIKGDRKSSLKFSSLGSSLSIGNYTSPIPKGDNLEPTLIKGNNSFVKPAVADKDLTVSDIPTKEVKSTQSSKNFTRSKSIKQVSNVTESELGIIQKQRQELQLLISELRDRDCELTDMVHAHQSQLLAWEEDRQKLLTLQQKCTNYEADIGEYKKNLAKLASYVKTLKTERQNQRLELDAMQQQLHRVNHEKGNQSMILSEFQEKDKNMSENVKALSSAIGRLEAREAELATLIKLKDKELTEASSHMTELTKRLGQMDQRFKECHHMMVESQQQAKDWKHKYAELKRDHDKLKENYTSLMSECNSRQAEAEESRKKVSDLEREITLAGERDCRKSDVLESMKAKQERTAQELATLRQLYDRQQRELSLLQLNLDSSRELVLKQQAGLDSEIDLIEPELIPEKEHESPRLYKGISSPDRTASPRNSFSPRRSKVPIAVMSPRSPRHNTSDGLQGEHKTSLEEERQKFDELYLKFLRDPEATGSPNTSINVFNPDDLNTSMMSDKEENVSPTSKLHKLLAESRLMVEKLEQSTVSKNPTMLNSSEEH